MTTSIMQNNQIIAHIG